MTPLTAEQAAAINTAHIAPGADANGVWLGYVDPATAAFITNGPPPKNGTWKWQNNRWTRDYSLSDLKALKIQELAREWDVEFHGGMNVGQVRVPTDQAAIVDYMLLRQMVAEGDWVNTPVKLVDGTFQVLNQTQASSLWATLKAHRRTLIGKLRDKVTLVNAPETDTPEKIAAITWTSTP